MRTKGPPRSVLIPTPPPQAEMGGHVAKKLGDGLMCLFGYPLAHENDAERAVRAALSIQPPWPTSIARMPERPSGSSSPGWALNPAPPS